MSAEPYSKSPVFDEVSLPASVRTAHNTKPGTWGLLRVLSGEVRLVFHEPSHVLVVDQAHPATIPPGAVHHVELAGPMQMQVEFYHQDPTASPSP
jgi:tellurite resistance-related uncharacterized protein